MNDELIKAKNILLRDSFTCVLCRGSYTTVSRERGVKPLLELLSSGNDLSGSCAADRVVGKGAAFLYVLLGVREVYALILSEPAKQVLLAHGIKVYYDALVPAIKNRTGNGFCPVESALADTVDPRSALGIIEDTLKKLNTNN